MNNILAVWKKLWQDNKFLKILSVILAFIIWIIVIAVASPVNEKTFYKIPVDITFEGSVPDRNGLIMLLSDTTMSVNVEVSGTRSSLVSVHDSDISASLVFDSVTAPGIYSVPISVVTNNAGVTVKDISPSDHVIIQFDKIATREIELSLVYTSDFPDGYSEKSHEILPTRITVTGPAGTVEEIDKAVIRLNPSDRTEDFAETYDIHLIDASGNNVDRKYLTLSTETAVASVSLQYTTTLPLQASLINTYGGNESYASVTFSPASVTLVGSDTLLKNMTFISAGEIKLEEYSDGDTVSLTLPEISGAEYVGMSAGDTVTATVTFPDTRTCNYIFTANQLNGMNLLPDDYTFSEKYILKLRLPSDVADTLTEADIKLTATLTEDGKAAHINVSLPDGIRYGVMEEYDVPVEKR